MPPKSKKDVQPVLVEDFSQDVLLLTTVQDVQLKLVRAAAPSTYLAMHWTQGMVGAKVMTTDCLPQGLLATHELLAPEPLADASAAPPLYVELLHANAAPVASMPAVPTAQHNFPINLEHKFRHRKGPDVIDTLINSSLEVRVCNSQSKAVLASAVVDLLPFGLGSSNIHDSLLPLHPADTQDAFKVGDGDARLLCNAFTVQ